jgi:hypothetical protein
LGEEKVKKVWKIKLTNSLLQCAKGVIIPLLMSLFVEVSPTLNHGFSNIVKAMTL